MESLEGSKMMDIIERIEMSPYNLDYEDIYTLKNSIDVKRCVDLRVNDIHQCTEVILEKAANTPVAGEIISIMMNVSSNLLTTILRKIGEILSSCGTSAGDVEIQIITNLSHSIVLLESNILLLNYIIKNPFDTDAVQDLPKVIATILMGVFSHCKNSESLYSTYFQQITSKITSVFKKCHELQVLYFTVLTEHVNFDLAVDSRMESFLEVLDVIMDIGDVVVALDVKSMAEQWKGYSKLCEKYSGWLEDKDIHVKATTLLCHQIQDGLNSLLHMESMDNKIMNRRLKSSNFMLKLVIKTCEMFGEAVSRDCGHIVQFISTVQEYSPPHLVSMNKNKAIVEGIRSHITVGAEPLICSMVSHQCFRQHYLEHMSSQSDSSASLGDLLLTVCIVKALLQGSETVRDVWTATDCVDDNITCILINMVKKSHTELLKNLKFESNDSKGGSVSLYDYVLSHCAALAVSCKDISGVEETMLMNVLQDNVWSAVFSIDLWNILARYCTPELRHSQLKYLIEIYNEFCNREILEQVPQKSYLTQLIRSLFHLLPTKLQSEVFGSITVCRDVNVWTAIGLDQLDDEYKDTIIMKANNELSLTLSSCNNVNEIQFQQMLRYLKLISILPEDSTNGFSSSSLSEMVAYLYKAWQRLVPDEDLLAIISNPSSHCVDVYFMTLCDVTANLLQLFSNEQLLMILQIITSIISKMQTSNKLSTLILLKSVAHLKINKDNFERDVVYHIATLFETLLQDSEPVVRINSLEAFSYVATNTINETIIGETVKRNKILKENVANFFSKKLSLETNGPEFQCILNNFAHKCTTYTPANSQSTDFDFNNVDDLFEDSDFVDSPNKKMKLETNADVEVVKNIIVKMTDDINNLMNYKERIDSSQELKKDIENICSMLNKLVA